MTKGDLVDYLDAVADRHGAAAGRPAAVGQAGAARAGAVHAAQRVARARRTGCGPSPVWSEGSHREIAPGALRRPAHAAVAGQPARRRVPRPVLPGRGAPSRPAWCSTSTRPRARTSRSSCRAARLVRRALEDAGLTGAVKTSGSKGVHVVVPVRGAPFEDVAAATRALAARTDRLDPELATTAYIKEDRRRAGLRRLDPVGPGHDRRRLQPPHPARAAGVVRRSAGTRWTTSGRRTSR